MDPFQFEYALKQIDPSFEEFESIYGPSEHLFYENQFSESFSDKHIEGESNKILVTNNT
jgi:hypothetical protein